MRYCQNKNGLVSVHSLNGIRIEKEINLIRAVCGDNQVLSRNYFEPDLIQVERAWARAQRPGPNLGLPSLALRKAPNTGFQPGREWKKE